MQTQSRLRLETREPFAESLSFGLGLTGLRDLISFLLYAERDTDDTSNPLQDHWGRYGESVRLEPVAERSFVARVCLSRF